MTELNKFRVIGLLTKLSQRGFTISCGWISFSKTSVSLEGCIRENTDIFILNVMLIYEI